MRKVNKPWGHEVIWAEQPKYLGKILNILGGKRLSLQYHKIKDETVMVLKGELTLEYGPNKLNLKTHVLKEGQTWHIAPGMLHRMSAVDDVQVLEVSTSELADVVRVEDDHGRVPSTI